MRTPTVKRAGGSHGTWSSVAAVACRGHRARHRRGAEQRSGSGHHLASVRGRGRPSAVGLSKDCGSVGQRPKQQHRTDAGRVAGSTRPRSAWRALGRPCLARRPGVGLGQPATMAQPRCVVVTVVGVHCLASSGMLFALGVATASRLGLARWRDALARSIRVVRTHPSGPRDGAAMLAITVAVSISTAAAAASSRSRA